MERYAKKQIKKLEEEEVEERDKENDGDSKTQTITTLEAISLEI